MRVARQKLFYFGQQQREPLVVLAMSVAFAGCIVLCGINPQLLNSIALQSLTSAAFAVFAAVLYVLYMLISRMVAIVLQHIESHSNNNKHVPLMSSDETELLAPSEADEDTTVCDRDEDVPREAIISSMYLGGSGAFLAIPPLCMWDISISSAFVLALLAIAFLDAAKVSTEFRANVDTVKAISTLQRLRILHQGAVLGMIISILWLDGQDRAFNVFTSTALTHTNNNTTTTTTTTTFLIDGQQWPLVLLAASSPFLLRGGPSRRGMTPSQTLETGLPVCTLLAILILCWYGPLENIMLTHFNSPLRTVLPMLILCPPCLAAALAFVVHCLKSRSAAVAATLLSIALFIKQQTLDAHHMRHRADWFALSSVVNLLISSLVFWLYRRRVVWVPDCDKVAVVQDLQHA